MPSPTSTKRGENSFSISAYIAIAILILVASGCATTPPPPPVELPSAEYHFEMGWRSLEKNDLDTALKEFTSGVGREPKYPGNYEGLAMVNALRGDFKSAEENAETALKYGKKESSPYITRGRILMFQEEYDSAIKWFNKALKRNASSAEAYYFIGLANLKALNFEKAADAFEKALDLEPNYFAANEEWDRLQKIKRAAPQSSLARGMAIKDALTRADIAALMIAEFDVDYLLISSKSVLEKPAAFDKPQYVLDELSKKAASANIQDISGHWAETAIRQVLVLGVMDLDRDGNFQPDTLLSRGDLASIMQRIFIERTGNLEIAALSIEAQTALEDVPRLDLRFNAVMLVIARDLMPAQSDGYFGVNDPVSGADALLGLAELRKQVASLSQAKEEPMAEPPQPPEVGPKVITGIVTEAMVPILGKDLAAARKEAVDMAFELALQEQFNLEAAGIKGFKAQAAYERLAQQKDSLVKSTKIIDEYQSEDTYWVRLQTVFQESVPAANSFRELRVAIGVEETYAEGTGKANSSACREAVSGGFLDADFHVVSDTAPLSFRAPSTDIMNAAKDLNADILVLVTAHAKIGHQFDEFLRYDTSVEGRALRGLNAEPISRQKLWVNGDMLLGNQVAAEDSLERAGNQIVAAMIQDIARIPVSRSCKIFVNNPGGRYQADLIMEWLSKRPGINKVSLDLLSANVLALNVELQPEASEKLGYYIERVEGAPLRIVNQTPAWIEAEPLER